MDWMIPLALTGGGFALVALVTFANLNNPTGGSSPVGIGLAFVGIGSLGLGVLVGLVMLLELIYGLLLPAPAAAQERACLPWSDMRPHLADRFGEVPVGIGVISERLITQLLVSGDGATFSIVTINPEGYACVIIAGRAWEGHPVPAGERL